MGDSDVISSHLLEMNNANARLQMAHTLHAEIQNEIDELTAKINALTKAGKLYDLVCGLVTGQWKISGMKDRLVVVNGEMKKLNAIIKDLSELYDKAVLVAEASIEHSRLSRKEEA